MSLIVHDEIGFGTVTKAAFYTDGGNFSRPADIPAYSSSAIWSPWGEDNLEPNLIANDIENCPVLSAGIETEARLAVGKSLDPFLLVDKDQDGNETLEWVSDAQVNDWLEDNNNYEFSYRNIYNMLGYGLGASQFILSKDRKYINRIAATNIYTGRLEKKNKFGDIQNLYLCADWENAPTAFDADKIKRVPLLREGYELQDLEESKNGKEFAILHRLIRNGRGYYPQPLHRSAKAWVKISRSVPGFKNALNANQMSIKYIILIADTYWKRIHKTWDTYTPEKRKEIIDERYREINDFLTGELNAGKSILAGKYYDPYSKEYVDDITITVVDDKMKEGKMLPDSAAADKQILFSMFFNPAIWGGNLLGDGASGGAGSGSDIREATLVLLMLLHPERANNLKIFNLVKKYNGWSKRLEKERDFFAVSNQGNNALMSKKKITPRLVFRYSSSVLTTLDTGKSTKPLTN
jgi:hypothetical protein